jgi:NADH-quinone oxidoreductase subunit J
MSFFLFYFIITICILSAFLLVFSRNPVFSILFLILVFVTSCFILFFLEIEYLPVILIIVYVGGITVLFLFVVVMLNIKISSLKQNNEQILSAIIIIVMTSFFLIFFIIKLDIVFLTNFYQHFSYEISLLSYDFMLTSCYNNGFSFKRIGLSIFLEHFFLFVISGYLLLLAMVGSIILTLRRFFKGRFQSSNYQIMQFFQQTIKY